MAECVSCGKEIPAGRFFCDDCYVKMKGERGILKKVPQAGAARPVEGQEGAGKAGEVAAADKPPAPVAGVVPPKKPSGDLTPASSKKVVSIKPGTDRPAKDKAGKKRFTVTITYSERTYEALARLKGRRKDEGQAAEGGLELAEAPPARARSAARGKGPHGRARLKAVKSSAQPSSAPKEGLMGRLAYRDRPWDRGDTAAVAMAAFSVLMIVILSFLPWASISWSAGEGAAVQEVGVRGTDLGALTYLCMALPIVALLYMVATWVFKGPFTKVDYGAVFILAGIVFIPLFYATIASNGRFLSAALQKAGVGGGPAPTQFGRQTLWPAYFMVLMGATLAFAGLIRLAERRGKKSGDDK